MSLHPAIALKNAEIDVNFATKSLKAEEMGFRLVGEAQNSDGELSVDIKKLFESRTPQSQRSSESGNQNRAPLALIIEPARELAGQVNDELLKFSKYLPKDSVSVLLLTGGGNPKEEAAALRSGRGIVAGTLGSIIGHVKKGTLSLENIRFFVLDEADTFATDNLPDVSFLHSKIPSQNCVQVLLFSATLHSAEILGLSKKIQSFPSWVDLKGKESVPDTVHHTMMRLDADADAALLESVSKHLKWPLDQVHKSKVQAVEGEGDSEMGDAADERSQSMKQLKLVALLKAIDAHEMSQAMIFARTQLDCDNVESFLLQCSGVSARDVNSRRFKRRRETGPDVAYSCSVLHGGRRQQERNEALAAFKAGEVRFLVCTDVAARGIDVVGLPYLVNMSLPDKCENYIHRVGRVGRAERLGLAVSLVAAQKEAVWFHSCGKPKGGVCNNRKLLSEGGCVIWQNEPQLLREVEERLKGRIEELRPDFRRKDETAAPVLYGARVGEADMIAEATRNIENLEPAVRELVRLEEVAQASFFALQADYPAI